jgi:hypothetical protein
MINFAAADLVFRELIRGDQLLAPLGNRNFWFQFYDYNYLLKMNKPFVFVIHGGGLHRIYFDEIKDITTCGKDKKRRKQYIRSIIILGSLSK